jgi:hypothetical protein
VQEPVGVFVEDDDIGHVRLIPHQQLKLKDGDKLYTTPPNVATPLAAQPAPVQPVAWRLNGESSLGHGKVFGKWKSGKPPKDVADLASVDKNWSLEFAYTTPPNVATPLAAQPTPYVASPRVPLTDEDCTRIYNEANGITTKNPPITTQRIFAAMRSAHGITEKGQP